jgi:hypothetical protein
MKQPFNLLIGAGAAIALAATIAIGSPAARAGDLSASPAATNDQPTTTQNELDQLRANQQLLQRRLDQLEQIAQVGVAHPHLPPGTTSLAGSFPRSFLIPGTDTSILIGGLVDLHASYFFQGGGQNANSAVPPGTGVALAAGIALDHTGPLHVSNSAGVDLSRDWFSEQASESRLRVETRTPTAFGEAQTVLEFDFYGCTAGATFCTDLNRATNPDVPRLRLAYGTLGGIEAGQNWVPGLDLESTAQIFDFFGVPGVWGYARAPQIGYKFPLAFPGATLGLYLVQPTGELATAGGAFESDCGGQTLATGSNCFAPTVAENPLKDPLPDFAPVLHFEQPWGELTVAGVVRDTQIKDTHFLDKSFLGYGGGISGNVKLPMITPNDRFGFGVWGCDGCGHWSNWTGGSDGTTQQIVSNYASAGGYGHVGVPFTAAGAAALRFATVTQWGINANFTHWWTPTVRTNVAWGLGHQIIPVGLIESLGTVPPEYNTSLQVLDANIIWSPVPFINTGPEFTWDHRFTVFNNTGNAYILSYDFQVKF